MDTSSFEFARRVEDPQQFTDNICIASVSISIAFFVMIRNT